MRPKIIRRSLKYEYDQPKYDSKRVKYAHIWWIKVNVWYSGPPVLFEWFPILGVQYMHSEDKILDRKQFSQLKVFFYLMNTDFLGSARFNWNAAILVKKLWQWNLLWIFVVIFVRDDDVREEKKNGQNWLKLDFRTNDLEQRFRI